MAGVAITLNRLTLKHAFGPVTADLPRGSFTQVVGAVGTGRSSLMLALAGRMRGCHGSGAVNGHSLGSAKARELMGVARVVGAIESDGHLRIRQLVKYGRLDGWEVQGAWELLGILPDHNTRLEELSEADRILVEVGLCVASGVGGLVVDDADAGLTTVDAEQVRAALHAVALSGRTVIASCTSADQRADVVIELPDVAHLPQRMRDDE